ncbi:MAG TPA: DUF1553 domain-containing protein [Bryobacteraceae bacterium]|nr:DUF1553 domain-containing protein [Bryobacteraceae bacterium]
MLRLFLCLTFAASAFAADILPLLREKCGACHDAKNKTSGFSVETLGQVIAGGSKYGKAVIGGHPGESVLLKFIRGEMNPKMPVGSSLSQDEIAGIENWIRKLPPEGAQAKIAWQWPYQKPVKHDPPPVKQASWSRNVIDSFILAKLEANHMPPAPEANKRTLARRVYFDLIGLPPTPQEMQAFLEDASADAYDRLVDRLLADPRYGERWGRHWLDLARYGETSGLEGDGAIGNAWRYRDWVIDAFNGNMPYDRFVLQQIGGGDEHSKTRNNYQPDPQGLVPTGFLRLAPWDRSNLVAADVRQNYLAEVTAAVGSVFMGMSIGCARCHDHKYDPIPTKDYYRFQAFFQTVDAGTSVEVPYRDKAFAEKAALKIKQYEQILKDGAEKKELDEFEKALLEKLKAGRMERAKAQIEWKPADLRLEMKLTQQRIFSEAERAHYNDLLESATRTGDADEQQALQLIERPFLDRLKNAYAGVVDPLKRFDALTAQDVRSEAAAKYSGKSIFTMEDKNRHAELSSKLDIYQRRLNRWKGEVLCVTNVPGPPNGPDIAPSRVLIRGDYRQPGEEVEPGFPTAIAGKPEPAVLETDRYRQFVTRGRRITLARWIASPDNPLTARVWVNRLWQQHFGQGIIRTASDFGVNGDRPSHPELLDTLAVQFMASGWDTKAMHKLMLTSAAYRQAAENPGVKDSARDPDNRLLWKFNRRRLEAEAIRDGILQVSGRLNPERGGPSVFPPLPDDLADFARYGRTGGLMWETNEKDEDARRRSIYIFQRRSLPLPMMAAFDALVFSESCERRSSTTTPLQALSMLNGYLVNEEASHLALRLQKEGGPKKEDQIRLAFEIVLNRRPSGAELDTFASFQGSLDALCRVLLNSNEFLYLE